MAQEITEDRLRAPAHARVEASEEHVQKISLGDKRRIDEQMASALAPRFLQYLAVSAKGDLMAAGLDKDSIRLMQRAKYPDGLPANRSEWVVVPAVPSVVSGRLKNPNDITNYHMMRRSCSQIFEALSADAIAQMGERPRGEMILYTPAAGVLSLRAGELIAAITAANARNNARVVKRADLAQVSTEIQFTDVQVERVDDERKKRLRRQFNGKKFGFYVFLTEKNPEELWDSGMTANQIYSMSIGYSPHHNRLETQKWNVHHKVALSYSGKLPDPNDYSNLVMLQLDSEDMFHQYNDNQCARLQPGQSLKIRLASPVSHFCALEAEAIREVLPMYSRKIERPYRTKKLQVERHGYRPDYHREPGHEI